METGDQRDKSTNYCLGPNEEGEVFQGPLTPILSEWFDLTQTTERPILCKFELFEIPTSLVECWAIGLSAFLEIGEVHS